MPTASPPRDRMGAARAPHVIYVKTLTASPVRTTVGATLSGPLLLPASSPINAALVGGAVFRPG